MRSCRTLGVAFALPLQFFLVFALCFVSLRGTAQVPTVPTYSHDVAPLLAKRCVQCHDGNKTSSAPFTLTSYEDAARRSQQIAQVTQTRFMPPWRLDNPAGFRTVCRLSANEIETLKRWSETGIKRGNPLPVLLPAPAKSVTSTLGKPDLVLKMSAAYSVSASTTDTLALNRSFVLPTGLKKDVWLRAIVFVPSNPRLTRSASIFADTGGRGKKLQSQSGAVGYTAFRGGLDYEKSERLGVWSPGMSPLDFPSGTSKRLSAGADFVLLLRFVPTGKDEKERGEIHLFFAKTAPRTPENIVTIGFPEVFLASDQAAILTDSVTLPIATKLYALTPHLHTNATTVRVEATFPDGKTKDLLRIADWDILWRHCYRFTVPLTLPAGTRIRIDYTFDNTRDNPRNNLGKRHAVTPGRGTMEEMGTLWLDLSALDPKDASALSTFAKTPLHSPKIAIGEVQSKD